ncbi:MAG: DUF59 domain-containing protein [Proteobacteria bacterium]|nr:DUF59 domain-containing protein [Pseudomonadota bacterium]
MHENSEKVLTRDCEAIRIPSGESIHLKKGTAVLVTQALGGSYTVAVPEGLARITSDNADALVTQPEGQPANVQVKMTLTAPGCGMGPVIAREAEQKILSIAGVGEATVEIVWDPPWNQAMISEVGKMKLGIL